MSSTLLDELIEAFCCLPGVGSKSAQRMSYQLLERNRDGGSRLAQVLERAMCEIGHCERCQTFCDQPLCKICDNPARDDTQLCIVASPADVAAIEQTSVYRGRYFVLMGHLSPLDGIGPQELRIDLLQTQLQLPNLREIILATSTTVEGEATAHYISELAKQYSLQVMRIAHGVPLGGELEFIDRGTLSHAFAGRTAM